MTYKWEARATCSYYYEATTGKIVASLVRVSLGDDVWSAEVNNDHLGQYISYQHGKKAVEQFIENLDRNLSEEVRVQLEAGTIEPGPWIG